MVINPKLSSNYGNLYSPNMSGTGFKQGLDVSRYPLDKSFLDSFQSTKMLAENLGTDLKDKK